MKRVMQPLPPPHRALSAHPGRAPRLHAESYAALLRSQNGGCAICTNPESMLDVDGQPLQLALYYSSQGPDAGMVRGLLCRACFTALVFLRDSPALLARAIAFLTGTPPGPELRTGTAC